MSNHVSGPVVRWGVIGAGDVVEHKSGEALRSVPGSALVAVMRRDAARAQEVARRFDVPRWTTDADALVAGADVDAVYVATPPDSHAEHVLRAAAAGKPVYVEKPMARTAAECERMIEACETAGVGLYVAYYRRTLPRFVAAAAAVQDGRIGQVRSVSVRLQRRREVDGGWRVDPAVSGGGLFVDLASHTLDWLDLVLGPVTHVSGDADGGPAETVVAATFQFAGGALGTGLWDFEAVEPLDVVELVGTGGTVRLSCFGDDPPQLVTASGVEALVTEPPPVVQWPMIENVVGALAGRVEPLSTGRTALRTARVVDSILAGHRERHGIDAAVW